MGFEFWILTIPRLRIMSNNVVCWAAAASPAPSQPYPMRANVPPPQVLCCQARMSSSLGAFSTYNGFTGVWLCQKSRNIYNSNPIPNFQHLLVTLTVLENTCNILLSGCPRANKDQENNGYTLSCEKCPEGREIITNITVPFFYPLPYSWRSPFPMGEGDLTRVRSVCAIYWSTLQDRSICNDTLIHMTIPQNLLRKIQYHSMSL